MISRSVEARQTDSSGRTFLPAPRTHFGVSRKRGLCHLRGPKCAEKGGSVNEGSSGCGRPARSRRVWTADGQGWVGESWGSLPALNAAHGLCPDGRGQVSDLLKEARVPPLRWH